VEVSAEASHLRGQLSALQRALELADEAQQQQQQQQQLEADAAMSQLRAQVARLVSLYTKPL
jgi:hypothetical protein